MKKNITINLFGTLYAIDEDAYELLQKYEANMRSYYSHKEGGEEIADDVEHRIAELFAELRNQGIEAITIEQVEEIIHRIGDPQEMEEGNENEGETTSKASAATEEKPVRRLYRDPEDKLLGGVISGICHYFGSNDPLPWRIVFVLLCLFSYLGFAVVYIVCWALIPEANTAEERLQMRGKPVNPKSINEEIMRGINKTKNYVTNPENQNKARGCFATFVKIILFCIGLFFVIVFGSALIGVLVAVVVALFAMIFGMGFLTSIAVIDPEFATFIESFPTWMLGIFAIATILFLAIPLVLVIRLMVKKPESPSMPVGNKIGILFIWLMALAVSIACVVLATTNVTRINRDFRTERMQTDKVENTRDGIYMSGSSWNYLDDNGWNVITYENGNNHINGWGIDPRINKNVECLVLKGRSGNRHAFKYQLEKTTNVRKGKYRIEAIVYADGQGNAIYAVNTDKVSIDIPIYTQSNFFQLNWTKAATLPYFQNTRNETGWKEVQRIADDQKWDYVYAVFEVEKDGTLKYGVTNSIEYNNNPWTGGKCDVMDLRLSRIVGN